MTFQSPPPRGGQVSAPPQAPQISGGPGAARASGVPGVPGVPSAARAAAIGSLDASQRPRDAAREKHSRQQIAPALPGIATHARASARLVAALARSRAWARPANAGARLAAFSIDAVFVLLASALVWVLASSVVLGVLVMLEMVVILAILESRTGITPGNLVLRLRTVRDDAPFSPGVARGSVRSLVQGGASLVALIGGWIVVATSAADPMRMGRSLADRAGRTMVVRVPTRAERAEWARGAEAWISNTQSGLSGSAMPLQQAGAQSMAVMQLEQPVPVAQPRIVAPVAPLAPVAPQPQLGEIVPPPQGQGAPPASAQLQPRPQQGGFPQVQQPSQAQIAVPQQYSHPGQVPPPNQAAPPAPQLLRPAVPSGGPNTGTAPPRAAHGSMLPAGVVPVDAPIAPPPPVRHVEVGEQLLLTFDTGQRAQLRVPVTVNLGRRPEQAEPEDQIFMVQDPENSVSKTHLRLDYRGESVWLTDLGSTNGSEIFDDTGEGVLLTRGVRVRLEDGSRVRIGSRSFTVAKVRGEG